MVAYSVIYLIKLTNDLNHSRRSERASKIKGLSVVVAYRFCAWETVGKLLQATPPRFVVSKKYFGAAMLAL
jgi:hypothetical protein